jgi:hypothetical protein
MKSVQSQNAPSLFSCAKSLSGGAFFTHQWPDDQVVACNIGELEMMTSIIAAQRCR